MNITKEQIKEVLNRQREYARYFYYGERAREHLNAHVLEYKGRRFSLTVRDDGNFELISGDLRVICEAQIVTARTTYPTSIDNLEYRINISNFNDMTKEEQEWISEAKVFVLSCFQRTAAFVFLARAQDETIERMASELALTNEA